MLLKNVFGILVGIVENLWTTFGNIAIPPLSRVVQDCGLVLLELPR